MVPYVGLFSSPPRGVALTSCSCGRSS
jgi:hypothetical protein